MTHAWLWVGSAVLLRTLSQVWVEWEEEDEEGPGPPAAPPQAGRPPGRCLVCPEDNRHTLELCSQFKRFSDSTAQISFLYSFQLKVTPVCCTRDIYHLNITVC